MSEESINRVSIRPETRHPRKYDAQKQLLLETASRLFAEQGYNSVTVRGIAGEAGFAAGAFYTYFSDKSDVLKHLCGETFTGLEAALDLVEERGGTAEEVLVEASREFARFAIGHPHHFKVFLMAATDFGDEKAVEFVGEMGMASFLRLRRIYEAVFQGMEEFGSFAWWNGLKGVVDFIVLHREKPWFDGWGLVEFTIASQMKGHRAMMVGE